jgi:hypothetical protein
MFFTREANEHTNVEDYCIINKNAVYYLIEYIYTRPGRR